MENSPDFDDDDTSEVINEPFPATETSPPVDDDPEVSSPPSEFVTSKKMKETHVTEKVGDDGSVQKEAHVTRKPAEKGKKEKEFGKKVDEKENEEERGGRCRRHSRTDSAILISVAVVAVVGALIAKLALARKITRA